MRVISIMQPGYLPWLGYFDMCALSNVFVVYDDVQFDRHGWRNRNRILVRGGPSWLTVPVTRQFAAPIREIRIADPRWPRKHLGSLRAAYGRAPFFDWCFPELTRTLLQRPYEWLLDVCVDLHGLLSRLLALDTPMRLASEIGYEGVGRTERLVAICGTLNASHYLATDASKAYMDEPLWRAHAMTLVYQGYPHPTYPQFDHPFVSHLSAVDALMFVGPEARKLLRLPRPSLALFSEHQLG
ncbi:MAG: WbqC family protein [Alphaproteobacteria bacterium]|nr:WbqC family protein [Alphaproteobacteria bacterium]